MKTKNMIQGPEPLNFDEGAKILIENIKNRRLKIMKAPIGLVRFFGHFNAKMNYGVKICEALNKYPEKFESDKAWQELGKPIITLKDYAASL